MWIEITKDMGIIVGDDLSEVFSDCSLASLGSNLGNEEFVSLVTTIKAFYCLWIEFNRLTIKEIRTLRMHNPHEVSASWNLML